ncbi:hypothetical protein BDZ45DRAFT_649084 [Acephala macrosclerotiorum]|nr:hypothetical protein BDZ45DRAFT_649084 [Acephala macrosclerotiorum]
MAAANFYSPLNLPDETRILTVSPGDYNAPIVCTLSTISLSKDTIPYEALSYCWSRSTTTTPPDPTTEVQCAVYDPTGKNTEARTLQFKDLVHNPLYENLYYQNGGSRPPGTITCDGVEMTIGGELYSALRRLRKEDEVLRIWVDAICINQSDMEERNLHVKMMGEVYAKAETVRVWLGEAVGIEEMALRCLENVNEKFNELFLAGMMQNRGAVQYACINDEKIKGSDWDELAQLLNRAWFERVWVIQEIANAKQAFIHIGRIVLGWDYFSAIISGMRSFNVDVTLLHCNGVKAICIMNMLREEKAGLPGAANRMPLLELLEETRDFKSTLACDKIYGILGLTKDFESVDVDYATDSPVIFQRLALAHLMKGESIDILYHCVPPSVPSELHLPSWVPDWTTRGHVEPFLIRRLKANATLDSKPKLRLDENGKILHITGKILDKIAIIEEFRPIPSVTDSRAADAEKGFQTPEAKLEARTDAFKEKVRIWGQNVLDIVFPDKVGSPELFENLWRTFMCNRTRDSSVPDSSCKFGFDIFMEAVLSCRTATSVLLEWKETQAAKNQEEGVQSPSNNVVYDSAVEHFHGAHSKWCYNRRFFKSEAGRFGWTVDGARVGDEICVLYGGAYPFVLRPDEDGCHTIVGDSYTHGLMEGEAMDESFPVCDFILK